MTPPDPIRTVAGTIRARRTRPAATLFALAVLCSLAVVATVPTAAAAPTVSAGDASVATGETTTVPVTLSEAPEGLAGFNVSVTVADGSTATVVDASVSGTFGLQDSSTADDRATLVGSDTGDAVEAGATDVRLGTVTLRGDADGTTALVVSVEQMDADGGARVNPGTEDGSLTVGEGGPSGPTLSVQPADAGVPTSGERTLDVVLDGVDNGVAAYAINLSVGDTSTAEITAISDATGGTDTTSVASGGTSASVRTIGASVSGSGPITLATVTVRGNAAGETTLTVTSNGVSDSANDAYSLAAVRGATLRVAEDVGPPPVCPGGSAPTDPDGDNVFEDANGDGSFDIFDVQCLLNNFDTTAVQNNAAAFDFTGDNSVDIFDIQAALNEV